MQLNAGDAAAFDGVSAQVRLTLADLGARRFDYLVNIAGASSSAGLMTIAEAQMGALYSVHFKGRLVPDAHASPADK